jgi:uncharacterized membrane protein YhaH (DUF805 family)
MEMGMHEYMEVESSKLTRRDYLLGGCFLLVCLVYAGVLIPLVQASVSGRMGVQAGEAARYLLARFMILPAVVVMWRIRGLDPRGVIRVLFGIVTVGACLLIGQAILQFVPHL